MIPVFLQIAPVRRSWLFPKRYWRKCPKSHKAESRERERERGAERERERGMGWRETEGER